MWVEGVEQPVGRDGLELLPVGAGGEVGVDELEDVHQHPEHSLHVPDAAEVETFLPLPEAHHEGSRTLLFVVLLGAHEEGNDVALQ